MSPAIAQAGNGWKDPSPHVVKQMTVEEGVQLEILDWGGKGRPLLLLAGLGDTAHVFDDFAPTLTRKFQVYAVTRRGFGASSAPLTGYGFERLADDVAQVIQQLRLEKVLIVGHSFAGEEMHVLGSKYRTNIAGLVYVDAAFNRGAGPSAYNAKLRELPPAPRPQPSDLASIALMRAFYQRTGAALLPEAEVRTKYSVDAAGNVSGPITPGPAVRQGIGETVNSVTKGYNPAPIAVPALALYAVPGKAEDLLRRYDGTDPAIRQKVSELFGLAREQYQRDASWFRSLAGGSAQVLDLPGEHHLFVSNPAEVGAAIEKFEASLR